MLELPEDQQENMNRLKAFISFLNQRYGAGITPDRVYYCCGYWSDFMHTKDIYRIRLSKEHAAEDKTMSGGSGAYDGTFGMQDSIVAVPKGTDMDNWMKCVKGLHKYWWDSIRQLSYQYAWQREPATVAYAAFEYIGQPVTIEKLN